MAAILVFVSVTLLLFLMGGKKNIMRLMYCWSQFTMTKNILFLFILSFSLD